MKYKTIQRDIVDMYYDDGLTNEEALEIEQQTLAVQPVPPVVEDWLRSAWVGSKAYRLELAREFRQAAETLRLGMVEDNRSL